MSLPKSPARNLTRIAKAANPAKIITIHDVKRSVFRAVNRRGASTLKAAAKLAAKAAAKARKGRSTSSGSGPKTRKVKTGPTVRPGTRVPPTTAKTGTRVPPPFAKPVVTTVSVTKAKRGGNPLVPSGKVRNPARSVAKLLTKR